MLSLEGVAFVYLARQGLVASKASHSSLSVDWWLWLLWCGYVTERWSEVSFTADGEVTWRHEFHRNFLLGFGLVAALWAVVLIKISPEWRSVSGNKAMTVLGMALGLLVILLPKFYHSLSAWIARAGLISVLLALIVTGFDYQKSPSVFWSVSFLAFANLVVLRRSELIRRDEVLRWAAPGAMVVGLVCLYFASASERWVAWATLWGSFGLWVLDRRFNDDDLEYYRARVDGVTLLALALGAVAAHWTLH
jgi:hypothetical protein